MFLFHLVLSAVSLHYCKINILSCLQSTDELRKKLRSQVMTGLREGVIASRIADFCNKKNNVARPTGSLSIIDTGQQTTVCGTGQLFNDFLQSGKVEGFTGFGTKPVHYYDGNFQDAAFRCVTFDQTFSGMPYDVRHCK